MFKYLLVPLAGEAGDLPVLRVALSIARLSGGHICCLHVCANLDEALITLARSADGPVMDTLERFLGPGDQKLINAQKEFWDFCATEGIGPGQATGDGPSAELKIEVGVETLTLPEYGRSADLLVMGRQRESKLTAMAVLESAILETGRPVILVPETAKLGQLGTLVVAWNGTVPSARAVANAIPLIERAERVLILTVAEAGSREEHSAVRLSDALRRHNSAVMMMRHDPSTSSTADLLLSVVRDEKADLLVMGAYGHAPMREVVLGGCTRKILQSAEIPVLLSH